MDTLKRKPGMTVYDVEGRDWHVYTSNPRNNTCCVHRPLRKGPVGFRYMSWWDLKLTHGADLNEGEATNV